MRREYLKFIEEKKMPELLKITEIHWCDNSPALQKKTFDTLKKNSKTQLLFLQQSWQKFNFFVLHPSCSVQTKQFNHTFYQKLKLLPNLLWKDRGMRKKKEEGGRGRASEKPNKISPYRIKLEERGQEEKNILNND